MMNHDISRLKQELLQLSGEHAAGALAEDEYEQRKSMLERELLDKVLASDIRTEPPAPAPAAAPTAPAAPSDMPTWLAAAAVALLAIGLAAGGGYWWVSAAAPQAVARAGGASPADAPAAPPHADSGKGVEEMIAHLAKRLQENPKDGAGWAMLARSYVVVGRDAEAVDAFARAAALQQGDAALLADYADALGVKNNRDLSGEPMQLVERALKLDPRNVKALALAGTYAFDRKDYRGAVQRWSQVEQIGGTDNLFAQQVKPGLAQARKLAGMPPSS